ncbi:MAG: ferritin-like domain-containing protein [Myxococcales bacterium]|nr:ferritin-like domain-containing protein [Myxococcales bacterium]
MLRSDRLLLLFASILAELALPGCIGGSGDTGCPQGEPLVKDVDAADLASALEDKVLSYDECHALCYGEPLPGATSGGASSSTGGETSGGETTGATSTSTGTSTSTSGASASASASAGESATAGYDPDFIGCEAIDGEDAKVACTYQTYCVGGRRPAGLCSEGRGEGETSLGRWLAELAHLEAASVPAFERLADELATFDAPAELIAEAEAAAIDEARHAALIGALAEAAGARPSAPELAPPAERSLLALAIENAVEGCVGETYAALVAAHQAEHAGDPALRACMAEIAADEARHAALAWAIDAWVRPRLGPAARAEVERARASAAERLRTAGEVDPALRRRAGLPGPARARRLWEGLDRGLWRLAA